MKLRLSSCDKWHPGEVSSIRRSWSCDHYRHECRVCVRARTKLRKRVRPGPVKTTYGVIALNWKAPEFV